MNIFKKLLISLLLALTVITSFAPTLRPVFAADDASSTWYNQNYFSWFVKVYDTKNSSDIFGERYTAAQVQWIFYSVFGVPMAMIGQKFFVCVFSGNITDCLQQFVAENTKTNTGVAQKAPPGIAQQIFADRPLSGITYTKNVFRKFQVIP